MHEESGVKRTLHAALTSLLVTLDENPLSASVAFFRPTWPRPVVAGAFVFPQTVRRGPVEKLRTFQKYNVSLEEIEHRANSFSRCGCVRRGAATDANARRTASRQIALASFVDNTLQTIQWFSHGIFVLRPHFLRHQAVWLLHVPRMGSQLGETRPRHTLSSGPLFFFRRPKRNHREAF